MMNELMLSFERQFGLMLPIQMDQDYPTHISVEEMIDMIVLSSKRSGLNVYLVLKHFLLTDDEIAEYFAMPRSYIET